MTTCHHSSRGSDALLAYMGIYIHMSAQTHRHADKDTHSDRERDRQRDSQRQTETGGFSQQHFEARPEIHQKGTLGLSLRQWRFFFDACLHSFPEQFSNF